MRGALLVATLAWASSVYADEMAFVDVFAANGIRIRSLDVAVKAQPGIASLFSSDPMVAHDWAITSVVNRTLRAQLAAQSRPRSAVARRVKDLEESLSPLFDCMPKNDHGKLDNGTVRYIVHRFLSDHHGWAIKGLEPAGGSWIGSLQVTADVRQVTKYILPAFLLEEFQTRARGTGLDLHGLANYVNLLQTLIHNEIIDYLYTSMRTLQMTSAGVKTEMEVKEIVSTFLMVFALGVNLEVTERRDIIEAKRYLDANHSSWQEMMAWMNSKYEAAAPKPSDFPSIQRFIETVLLGEYADWQGRDCKTAMKALTDHPELDRGRVNVDSLRPILQKGHRPMLARGREYMGKLGVLETATGQPQRLIVSNFMASQAMCLTTASFYMVCCRNPCDDYYKSLEAVIRAPVSQAQRILEVLRGKHKAGAPLTETAAADLSAIADADGMVQLYGREFSRWLHDAYPLECPMPSDHMPTNPKTPDGWMVAPGTKVGLTEDLVEIVSDTMSVYTSMGGNVTKPRELYDADRYDVLKIYNPPTHEDLRPRSSFTVRFTLQLAMASSVFGVVYLLKTLASMRKSGLDCRRAAQVALSETWGNHPSHDYHA